jgi:hypothetical protein
VWEAWETTGTRAGRWASLLAAGATIRACPLEEYEPYRQPKPVALNEPTPGRYVEYDPEDAEHTEAMA